MDFKLMEFSKNSAKFLSDTELIGAELLCDSIFVLAISVIFITIIPTDFHLQELIQMHKCRAKMYGPENHIRKK